MGNLRGSTRWQDMLDRHPDVAKITTARFMSKLKRRESGCWEWSGGKDKDGYGKFQITNPDRHPKQFHVRAHRFAAWIRHGRADPSLVACHSCDNPACARPDHIDLATQHENIQHCYERGSKQRAKPNPSKGRLVRGENHGCCKITEAQAREVKLLLLGGMRPCDVAKATGVRASTVYSISQGRNWAWLEVDHAA